MGATDRRPHATRTHRAQSGPTKLNTDTSLTWIPMEPSFESAVGVRGGATSFAALYVVTRGGWGVGPFHILQSHMSR